MRGCSCNETSFSISAFRISVCGFTPTKPHSELRSKHLNEDKASLKQMKIVVGLQSLGAGRE